MNLLKDNVLRCAPKKSGDPSKCWVSSGGTNHACLLLSQISAGVEVLGCYGGSPVSVRCNPVFYSTSCEKF